MDLFNQNGSNLLPFDGEVYYYGSVFSTAAATSYYDALMHGIAWRNDEAMMFGKKIITKRKVAWYGDQAYDYTYSKITRKAFPWTPVLRELRERCSELTSSQYNSCLLNLYHSGEEGMAWHSDDEKDLVDEAAIASLSFGATRKFGFKHKETKQTVYLLLEPGSLLVMKGSTQKNWLHRLPPTARVHSPRINLTFRKMA